MKNNIKFHQRSTCKHKVAFFKLAPLTRNVTCSKLKRYRENIVDKNLSVEHTHKVRVIAYIFVLDPVKLNILDKSQNTGTQNIVTREHRTLEHIIQNTSTYKIEYQNIEHQSIRKIEHITLKLRTEHRTLKHGTQSIGTVEHQNIEHQSIDSRTSNIRTQ